jgi:hypothetical protein
MTSPATSPIGARQARSVGASACRTPRLWETDDDAKSEVEESRDSSPGLLSIRPGHPELPSRSSHFSSLGGHLPRVPTSLPDSSCPRLEALPVGPEQPDVRSFCPSVLLFLLSSLWFRLQPVSSPGPVSPEPGRELSSSCSPSCREPWGYTRLIPSLR